MTVQQRLPSALERPIMFAHRGARAHAPENTLEAFALGLRLGATGIESDVWLTRDQILGARPRRASSDGDRGGVRSPHSTAVSCPRTSLRSTTVLPTLGPNTTSRST